VLNYANCSIEFLHVYTNVFIFKGATYSSKIALEESIDVQDIDISPEVSLLSSSFVLFDLETTGLG
jgi:hypothetical protein